MTTYCPVCGKRHPELADCAKYGVSICSRHCDTCQYKLGQQLIRCGHGSVTKAVGMTVYMAAAEDIKREKEKMRSWSNEKIAQRYEHIKEIYRTEKNGERNLYYRPILAACQQLMYERTDSLLASVSIPLMESTEIKEYRIELCRLIAENKMNETLKSAVTKALEICCEELSKRSVAS